MKKIRQIDDLELLKLHYVRNQKIPDKWVFIIGLMLLFGWFLYVVNLGIFITWILIMILISFGRSGDNYSDAIKNEIKRRGL